MFYSGLYTVEKRNGRKETEFSSSEGEILTTTKIIWEGVQLSEKAAFSEHFQSDFQLQAKQRNIATG